MEATDMQIPLSDAIQQLRSELRKSILEGIDQDIIFTASTIDIELSITFGTEAKAGGGVKLLTYLDISGEGKLHQNTQHKIKLSLSVCGKNGNPLKVKANEVPSGL